MSDLLAGRYRLEGILGEGAMGTVHAARDTVSGRDVALKVMNPELASEPGHRWRFKQEFWLLCRLGHPGIVAAFDLGHTEEGVPCFAMERATGGAVPEADPANAEALDRFACGILRALGYLHSAGYFHGDVKPDNCRVLADGTVKLLDFGLAEPIGTVRDTIRGTPEYLAPEALRGQGLDGRLDLYALGCTLHELIGGRPPFCEANPWRLLHAHATEPPPALGTLGTPLARRWATIVARLLAKDPRERYASAAAVLEALGEDPGALPDGLLESPLVGVEGALVRIREALDLGLSSGDGIMIEVIGAAGTGKSRVLAAVRAGLQVVDRPLSDVRGMSDTKVDDRRFNVDHLQVWVGQADGLPYGLFRPIVKQALDAVRRAHPDRDPARDRGLAPLLGAASGAGPADAQSGRLRMHESVASLLFAAVEAFRGAAVIVDRAELLDPESEELLASLRRDPRCRPICWVLAGHAAAGRETDLVVDLPALAESGTAEICAAMLGSPDVPAGLAEQVHTASRGNPRQVARMVAGLAGTGILRRAGARWELARPLPPLETFAAVGGPRPVAGADASALVELADLVGRPFPPDIVAAALGWDEGRMARVLDDLLRSGVMKRVGMRFMLDRPPSGDLPEARQERIGALTAAFCALPDPLAPDDAEILWELANAAGATRDPAAAIRAGLASGRRRLDLYAAESAARRFQAIVPLLAEASPADRLAAWRGLGDALRLAGRAVEAEEPYREAIALARTLPPDPAMLADLLVSSGKVSQTRSDFEAALSAFGEAAGIAESGGQDDVRARALAARARVHYFKGHATAALRDARDAVAAARSAGDEAQEAVALTFEGFLLASSGGADREAGLAALECAIAISERLGDRYTQNLAHSYLGNAAMAVGDLNAARGAFEQNRRICRAIGARDEEVFAILNLAAVALEADDYPGAGELAAEAAGWALEADRRFPLAMARALQGAAAVARGEDRDGFDRLDEALALAGTLGNTYLEGQILALAIQADLSGGRHEAAGGRLDRLAALGQADLADRLSLLRGTWLADLGRHGEARAGLARALASENRVIARRAALVASRDLLPVAAGGHGGIPFLRACAEFAERAASDGADDLFDRLAGASLELANADRALILLYEQGRLVTRLTRGAGSEDWSYSTTIAKRVLWSGEPLRIADTRADERLAESRSVAGMPLRSVICVPLATQELSIGVLYLDRPTVAGPFGEEAGMAVEALASVASLALARAWRVRDLERELAVEAALGALATALLAEASADGAVRLGLETALRLVPADRALFVDLAGDGTPAVRLAVGPGGRELAPASERVSSSIVGWVAETGEATAILDATEDASWGQQQSVPALDLRAVLCAPFCRAGKVAGVLWLDARDPAVQYADVDARVAQRIIRILEPRLG